MLNLINLINNLFPPLVYFTDFFSEMLYYYSTGIPKIIFY